MSLIDFFTVFTLGGAVVWQEPASPSVAAQFQPAINNLIQDVLLNPTYKQKDTSFNWDNKYVCRWTQHALKELVFVAVMVPYTNSLGDVDSWLQAVKAAFVAAPEKRHFAQQYQQIVDRFFLKQQRRRQPTNQKRPHTSTASSSSSTRKAQDESLDHSRDRDGTLSLSSEMTSHSTVDTKDKNDSGFWSLFRGRGVKETVEMLREKLLAKNVCVDVVDALCQGVTLKLNLSPKIDKAWSFQLRSTVLEAMEEVLMRCMQPNLDLLPRIALSAQESKVKRPYCVVLVGVNGVGKTTTLAKLCYRLAKSHKLSVGVVAADTFRAGAVEQLRTHCTALSVPLFERGYNKDPASVAFHGLQWSQKLGHDVVLIDTAGRMQGNDALMRALCKLVAVNGGNIDLVLFVGEALVGSDGVDQVLKFDRALMESAQRSIDGLILTKWDTVDKQGGTAINLTHATRKPILYVGTGQTYTALQELNANTLVRSLLKE